MSALGLSRRQMILLGVFRSQTIAVFGALGGIVLALLLSPLTPVGEARVAEPSTGFVFDPLVLLIGAATAAVVIIAAGLRPAFQTARVRQRSDDRSTDPSSIVEALNRGGAPVIALIGVERAEERGRGSSAIRWHRPSSVSYWRRPFSIPSTAWFSSTTSRMSRSSETAHSSNTPYKRLTSSCR